MKIGKLIAALGLLSLSCATAMAADLAAKAPVPPTPIMSWTGFYIGVNGGAGLATDASTPNFASLRGVVNNTPAITSHELNGFLAGGQIGANYQAGKFLVGVEGSGDWANIQGTATVGSTIAAKMRWMADATVRAGVLPTPDLLIYAKGGAAWAGVNHSFSFAFLNVAGINSSATEHGGMIGFGTEYVFAPHWTAKFEYNYADYGKHTDMISVTPVGVGGVPPGALPVPVQTQLQAHTVKGGINYLF